MFFVGDRRSFLLLLLVFAAVHANVSDDDVDEEECSLVPPVPGPPQGHTSTVESAVPNFKPPAPLSEMHTFLAVMTGRANAERRLNIRKTWQPEVAKTRGEVQYRFMVGARAGSLGGKTKPVEDAEEAALREEMATYGDIVLLDEPDFYTNMANKVVATYAWANANIKFKFLAKVDDDVVVVPDRLLGALKRYLSPERLYIGARYTGMKPFRDKKSKWHLPKEIYWPPELPPMHEGFTYILSEDMVGYIARNREYLRPLRHLDDATVALWMLSLQVHPKNDPAIMTSSGGRCNEEAAAIHTYDPKVFLAAWDAISSGGKLCKVPKLWGGWNK